MQNMYLNQDKQLECRYFSIIDKILMKTRRVVLFSEKSTGKTYLIMNYIQNKKQFRCFIIGAESDTQIKLFIRQNFSKFFKIDAKKFDDDQLLNKIRSSFDSTSQKYLLVFLSVNDCKLVQKYMLAFDSQHLYLIFVSNDKSTPSDIDSKILVDFSNQALYYSKFKIEDRMSKLNADEMLLLKWILAFRQTFVPYELLHHLIDIDIDEKSRSLKETLCFRTGTSVETIIGTLQQKSLIQFFHPNIKINSIREVVFFFRKQSIDILYISMRILNLLSKCVEKDKLEFKTYDTHTFYRCSIHLIEYFENSYALKSMDSIESMQVKMNISNLYHYMIVFNDHTIYDSKNHWLYTTKCYELRKKLHKHTNHLPDAKRKLYEIIRHMTVISEFFLGKDAIKQREEMFIECVNLGIENNLVYDEKCFQSLDFMNLGVFYYKNGQFEKANYFFQNSLISLKCLADENKIIIIHNISKFYEPNFALKLLNNLLNSCRFENNSFRSELFIRKAICYKKLQNYTEALANIDQAEKFLPIGDSIEKVLCYFYRSQIYQLTDKLDLSGEFEIKYKQILNDRSQVVLEFDENQMHNLTFTNIFDTNKHLEATEKNEDVNGNHQLNDKISQLLAKAISFDSAGDRRFFKPCLDAIELCNKHNDSKEKARVYKCLGDYFDSAKDSNCSRINYLESFDIIQGERTKIDLDNFIQSYLCANYVFYDYYQNGKLTEAMKKLDECLQFIDNCQDSENTIAHKEFFKGDCYRSKACILKKTKKPDDAIKFYTESNKHLQGDASDKERILKIYFNYCEMKECYEEKSDTENSLKCQKNIEEMEKNYQELKEQAKKIKQIQPEKIEDIDLTELDTLDEKFVMSPRQIIQKPKMRYNFEGEKYCLIINNRSEQYPKSNDVKLLIMLFENLGFSVKDLNQVRSFTDASIKDFIKNNLKEKCSKKCVKENCENCKIDKCACLVIIILDIKSRESDEFNTEMIKNLFSYGVLKEKPIIYIIDTCSKLQEKKLIDIDKIQTLEDNDEKLELDTQMDMFIWKIRLKRLLDNGNSPFIRCLVLVMSKHYFKNDILRLHMITNRVITNSKYADYFDSYPYFNASLRKHFYFDK